MKKSKILLTRIILGGIVIATHTVIFNSAKAEQRLQSGTAGATTTPQYAKKVAQTYCDFLTAGISPGRAIKQAESEVSNSARKPQPFNMSVYEQTLEKAISEKGFCPSAPKIEELVLERGSCNLSSKDRFAFERDGKIKKIGSDCLLYMQVH